MMQRHLTDAQGAGRGRIAAIDAARGAALAAMAIYHFAWDLEFFGYADPGMTAEGGWRLFARSIASTFLVLVGVSLVLAHGEGMRWRGFAVRLAQVAGAALAITAVTRIATPDSFIFFGILHQIAFASVAGLAFLRLPAALTLAAAVLVVAAPSLLRSEGFDHPALWWLGLSVERPRSNDFVPVFPFFGAVLAGIAVAKAAKAAGLFEWMRTAKPGRWSRPLLFAGRHSLAVYLIHQPVLIALVFLATLVAPPAAPDRAAAFVPACETQCAAEREASFCSRYCACMLTALQSQGRLDALYEQPDDAPAPAWLDETAWQCMVETETPARPQAEEDSEP